jgi:hypothetical protein
MESCLHISGMFQRNAPPFFLHVCRRVMHYAARINYSSLQNMRRSLARNTLILLCFTIAQCGRADPAAQQAQPPPTPKPHDDTPTAQTQSSKDTLETALRTSYALIEGGALGRVNSEGRFLILFNPGLPLDLSREGLASTSAKVSNLVDSLPPPSWKWNPTDKEPRLIDTIRDLLKRVSFPEPGDGPTKPTLSKVLFADEAGKVPTQDYKTFLELKKNEDDLKNQAKNIDVQLNVSNIPQQDRIILEISKAKIKNDLNRTTAKFSAIPNIKEIQLAHLKSRPPPQPISKLTENGVNEALDNYTGASFSKSIEKWSDTKDWIGYSAEPFKTDIGSPVFKIAGDEEQANAWYPEKLETALKHMPTRLALEYQTVDIKRPILLNDFLTSDKWKLKDRDFQVSNGGNPALGDKPEGKIPLYITQILLTRSVRLGIPEGGQELALYDGLDSPDEYGFGPFVLRGKYWGSQKSFIPGKSAQEYLSSTIQLSGVICRIVPMNPQSNSK